MFFLDIYSIAAVNYMGWGQHTINVWVYNTIMNNK